MDLFELEAILAYVESSRTTRARSETLSASPIPQKARKGKKEGRKPKRNAWLRSQAQGANISLVDVASVHPSLSLQGRTGRMCIPLSSLLGLGNAVYSGPHRGLPGVWGVVRDVLKGGSLAVSPSSQPPPACSELLVGNRPGLCLHNGLLVGRHSL